MKQAPRGGTFETMEGDARERNVVVEFKDRATALACYQSPEYQGARTIRQKYADADFIIIDGDADCSRFDPLMTRAALPPVYN